MSEEAKAGPVSLTEDQVRAMVRGDAARAEVDRLIESHSVRRRAPADIQPAGGTYDSTKQRPRAASAEEASRLPDTEPGKATKEESRGGRPDQKPPR
ncbi:MAG: hypothetical protein GEU99_17720 [Luteitalea sp.]|nr:hypothetical protein [Luteitalea sp.]